jgi:hypothetical protein
LRSRRFDGFSLSDTNEECEAKTLSLSVYLNKSLCHQKLNDLDEVRHAVRILRSCENFPRFSDDFPFPSATKPSASNRRTSKPSTAAATLTSPSAKSKKPSKTSSASKRSNPKTKPPPTKSPSASKRSSSTTTRRRRATATCLLDSPLPMEP